MFQLVLPVGKYRTQKYGDLEFTYEFCQRIVANFALQPLGNREPFIDVDHDHGAAQGWVKALDARPEGLFAEIEWTDDGKEKVEKKLYKYFSPELAKVFNLKGEPFYPVLVAVALTNSPVINILPEIQLSEITNMDSMQFSTYLQTGLKNNTILETGKGITDPKIKKEVSNMNFDEIIKALSALGDLTDEQKKQLLDTIGFEVETEPTKKIEPKDGEPVDPTAMANKKEVVNPSVAMSEVSALKDLAKAQGAELARIKLSLESEKVEKALALALSEGRIVPADKKVWERRLSENFASVSEILKEMPVKVVLSEKGSESSKGSGSMQFSEKEAREIGERMGWSEEEIKNFMSTGSIHSK